LQDTSRRIEDLVFPQYLRFKWRGAVSGGSGRKRPQAAEKNQPFTPAPSAQHLAMRRIVCNNQLPLRVWH